MHRTTAPVLLLLALVLGESGLAAEEGFEEHLRAANDAKAAKDWPTMEAELERALELGAGSEYAWRSLAWAEARQGKWEESLAHARRNLELHGETGATLRQLFDSAMVAGDLELAREALDRADRLPEEERSAGLAAALSADRERLAGWTEPRRYRLTLTLTERSKGKPRRYLLPALKAPRQTFEVEVEGAESHRIVQEGRSWILEVTTRPDEPVRITGVATIEPLVLGPDRLAEVPPGPAPEEMQGYLGPYRNRGLHDPSQEDVQAVALPLRGKTGAETVQDILGWLRANILRKGPFGPDDLSSILKDRRGLCHHHSNLTPALARAAGVPAVIAHGSVLPERKGTLHIGHGWVEVYLNGLGWVPIEPMDPGSLRHFGGADYLLFHTIGHDAEEDHFTRRDRSLQGYPWEVERLD